MLLSVANDGMLGVFDLRKSNLYAMSDSLEVDLNISSPDEYFPQPPPLRSNFCNRADSRSGFSGGCCCCPLTCWPCGDGEMMN